MAKQGVGQHVIIKTGNIDRHKITGTPAQGMYGLGNKFLAHPGLPGNQHGFTGGGDCLDVLKQRVHGLVMGNDMGKRLGMIERILKKMIFEGRIFPAQMTHFRGPAYTGCQAGLLTDLGEEIIGALFHAGHCGFHLVQAGNDNNWNLGKIFDHQGQQFIPGHVRHGQIQDKYAEFTLAKQVQHLAWVTTADKIIHACRAQGKTETMQPGLFVVNQ